MLRGYTVFLFLSALVMRKTPFPGLGAVARLSKPRSFHASTRLLDVNRRPWQDVNPGAGFAFMNQIFVKDIMKALWLVTIYTIRQPSVTIFYPYERNTKSTRFRGEHALMIYPDGDERCITCQLCEVTCPAQVCERLYEEFDPLLGDFATSERGH